MCSGTILLPVSSIEMIQRFQYFTKTLPLVLGREWGEEKTRTKQEDTAGEGEGFVFGHFSSWTAICDH